MHDLFSQSSSPPTSYFAIGNSRQIYSGSATSDLVARTLVSVVKSGARRGKEGRLHAPMFFHRERSGGRALTLWDHVESRDRQYSRSSRCRPTYHVK